MKKKYYYEKTETRVVNVKGYLEIETEYIQIYRNFVRVSSKLNSVTGFKLLHWLLAERMSEENGLNSTRLLDDFNNYLRTECGQEATVSKATFHRALGELVEVGALSKLDRAVYYANPNLFWSADTQDRVDLLKAGDNEGSLVLLNP